MNRRNFTTLLGAAAVVWPFAAYAQKKAKVVGYLYSGSIWPNFSIDPDPAHEGPVRKGLRETGNIDGQNVRIEYRFAEDQYDRLPGLAADLVSRGVDVILANSGTPGALAAKRATATIPIVFVNVSDPVAVGLVANLARPGGNATGFSDLLITSKALELISELVPGAGTIALLVNPENQNADLAIQSTQRAAGAKGINLVVEKARTEPEIAAAFNSLVAQRAGALVVDADMVLAYLRPRIAALAQHHAVPTIYPDPNLSAERGGLISYGPDLSDVLRQAGVYAGQILNGARPADLPVQQPTLFRMVINLRTARDLGLTVPPALLFRADEVIE